MNKKKKHYVLNLKGWNDFLEKEKMVKWRKNDICFAINMSAQKYILKGKINQMQGYTYSKILAGKELTENYIQLLQIFTKLKREEICKEVVTNFKDKDDEFGDY